MTITEFLDLLEVTLAQAEDGPPEGLHPAGTFAGHAPPEGCGGLIVRAPDGSRFCLLAWKDEPAKS